MFGNLTPFIIGLGCFLLGVAITLLARQVIATRQLRIAEKESERLLAEARAKSKELILEAKEESIKIKAAAEAESRERRYELQRFERRLNQKDENLERKQEALTRRENILNAREKDIESIRAQLEELKKKQIQQLETIAGMSSAEAKDFLLQSIEEETKVEASRRLRDWEAELKEKADAKAREILTSVIQRLATDVVSETTVSVVSLPSDEMKGRLIGREGRNIRALEMATGVDLIIDDTPGTVTLSSFDPVRREVAAIALHRLILNGRIHPARIEEIVDKAKAEVETTICKEGEQAVYETKVQGVHPEIIKLLGRLKYRTSYGQNVLLHSKEVAHLAGMLALELGVDPHLARKAGLLHDIGKAIDHEVSGPHALIGTQLIEQWEKSPEIARAIAEHHGETNITSTLGFIITTADAISGSRHGARRESLEQYLKRLEALENIATSFTGVEKAFAVQAGREVRILVKPETIDDLTVMRLARDIAKKIEETLTYPGQIKITVIRETRAVDYAK